MNKGSTVGWEGWHSTRAVWNLSQSRAVARMAGLKLSLVQALSLQLSDSVTSTLSASVSFHEHWVRVLTCSQVRGSVRDAESRCASQESVKGCGDGRFPVLGSYSNIKPFGYLHIHITQITCVTTSLSNSLLFHLSSLWNGWIIIIPSDL